MAEELADTPKSRIPRMIDAVRELGEAAEVGTERRMALDLCLAQIKSWAD